MIEMGKKYQTRDGRAVRILCVDGPSPSWPVIGFVGDERQVDWWTANGFHGSAVNNRDDLIPVLTKHEGWIIINHRGQIIDSFDTGTKASVESLCHWCEGETVHHAVWED